MASIQEQLDRDDWDPMPDDQLVGEITAMSVRVGKSDTARPYPVLVVRDGDGAEHIVSCAMFADDVVAQRPKIGERVGIRYCGPQQRADGNGTYDKYVVAFEREDAAEPDWDYLATARGVKAKPGGSGKEASDATQASRMSNPFADDLPPEPTDDYGDYDA